MLTAREDTRRRHFADLLAAMPGYVARLSWTPREIATQRRRALRLLLRVAVGHSPWYRERLRDIDPGTATEADLERVPPMTRADLMDNWNEIAIYPSLTLETARRHLAAAEDEGHLQDAFQVVASSSGGVFLYDWEAWIASFAGCARWRLLNRAHALEARNPKLALVTSDDPRHVTRALIQGFVPGPVSCFPARLPLDEIVRGLNATQPDVLNLYPSVARALVREAHAGSLRISPNHVSCTGEPLSAELRDAIAATWRAGVSNSWSASEAVPLGQSCSTGSGIHLNDDLVIVEPVDVFGKPVPAGVPSTKVHVTSLFNLALPLIRYELADRVSVSPEPCGCGSAYRLVEEVQGRFDDRFVYPDGVAVEAEAIASVLRRERSLVEYQVRQTDRGAEVHVRGGRNLHLRAVGQRVASALGKGGLSRPSVSVKRVESFERGPTGKLRRFVPQAESQGAR